MLTDISYFSWEWYRQHTAPTESNPHTVSEDQRRAMWDKRLSPEALKRGRLQKGVYHSVCTANHLRMYSDIEVIEEFNQWDPTSGEEFISWYGRSDTVEQAVAHLRPVWQSKDRHFFIEVLYSENGDHIEKPWKMGDYIGEYEEWDHMSNGYWQFHLIEIKPTIEVK